MHQLSAWDFGPDRYTLRDFMHYSRMEAEVFRDADAGAIADCVCDDKQPLDIFITGYIKWRDKCQLLNDRILSLYKRD